MQKKDFLRTISFGNQECFFVGMMSFGVLGCVVAKGAPPNTIIIFLDFK